MLESTTLLWRHNWRDGVSNHQPHDCLLNHSFGHRSKKTPKPRVTDLCEWWIHRWLVNCPYKWPVTRKMFPFDDVITIFLISQQPGAPNCQSDHIVSPHDTMTWKRIPHYWPFVTGIRLLPLDYLKKWPLMRNWLTVQFSITCCFTNRPVNGDLRRHMAVVRHHCLDVTSLDLYKSFSSSAIDHYVDVTWMTYSVKSPVVWLYG